MKTKQPHTPSPWPIKKTSDKCYNITIGEQPISIYKESDAFLTASAPELLTALQNLAAYANGRLGKNPYSIPEYKQALIAIGKAIGRPIDGNSWMDTNREVDKAENDRRME